MMDRVEVLKTLAEFRTNEVVVLTMSVSREFPQLSPSLLNFEVLGAMGYASSVGLGIAMGCPDRRVIVLDGDGSLLMNLGTLVTISGRSPANLVHFVFENGMYELTDRVPLPGNGKVSLSGLARSVGITKTYEFDSVVDLREQLVTILGEPGPIFVDLKVAPGPRAPFRPASETELALTFEGALQPSQPVLRR